MNAGRDSRGQHSPRIALALMCVIVALLGMAMGNEHGVAWIADGLPGDSGVSGANASTLVATPPGAGEGHTAGARALPGPAEAAEPSTITRALNIVAVGDTMMGSPRYGLPADAGASFFAQVSDLLAGDLVLANLEGTFSTTAASKCPALTEQSTEEERRRADNCFAFQTPPEYARHMAASGVNVANLANNHSNDFGPAGREETLRALDAAGIGHTGLAGTDATLDAAGGRIVVLGFAPYAWADPLLDVDAAIARIREASTEADIVVVNFHGGAEGVDAARVPDGPEEYLGEQRGEVRRFARAAIDAGADLVVGHGPHVLRGLEVYEGRLIAYSLGNFGGYGSAFNLRGPLSVSMVLRAVLEPDGTFRTGRIHPTVLSADGTPARGGEAIETVRDLSRADFGAQAPRIAADGTILPPMA